MAALIGTKVGGQAGVLAPLVGPMRLYCGGTAVAGCAAFCAAGEPFHAHCGRHCGSCTC
jgi:hypothetical protein